jgi:chemotaxis protein MotA
MVFGGFALSGGNLVLIFAPWHEFLMIAGAAVGGLIVKSSPRTLKLLMGQLGGAFKGKLPDKALYLECIRVVHDLSQLSRKEGVIVIEGHVKDPSQSAIFRNYPRLLARHDLLNFITDNLKLILMGITPEELENVIDTDIETLHEEHTQPQSILANTADAFPGLGIVAAVMGIIKTMASVSEGPEVVGEKVAAALVGTFLGVLLCYGIVGPIATNIEMANQEENRLFQVLKQGLIGFARGVNPKVSAEYSRRAIYEGQRPNFEELEVSLKG